MYRNRIKRLLDILLSACGILCLSWLLLLLAVAIKLDSPGPVFFRQKRVGIGKRHFQILKFRTMRIDTPHDMPTHLLHDPEQYITRMGHFLRKTSLDELPQFFNVLNGSMSLVGPRPPLPKEVEKYTPYQMHRLDAKGGITCYWQCSGRSNIMFDEWVELDLKYIRDRSISTDAKILAKTAVAVLRRDGAE